MNNKNENEYLVIWEFQVKPAARLDFEKIYGPAGGWANLFRRSRDYRGTQLVCDIERPGRYLTLDRWTSREALHQFKQVHQSEYEAFDKQCETLTDNESLLGEFEYHATEKVA
jgi:quinol monooxygenase YgiN